MVLRVVEDGVVGDLGCCGGRGHRRDVSRSGRPVTWPRETRVLSDRSSAPSRVHNRTEEHTIEAIAALRRLRLTGPEIAEVLDRLLSRSRGSAAGSDWESSVGSVWEPVSATERARPGELIHVDVKKLGRIEGGAGTRSRRRTPLHADLYRHDRSAPQDGRVGVLPRRDRRRQPARLCRAARRREGGDRHRRSAPRGCLLRRLRCHRRARHDRQRRRLPLRHPPPPFSGSASSISAAAPAAQTNGKAERFIRTMLGGWAYGAIYGSTHERAAALYGWLYRYNHHRRHSALSRQTPAQATSTTCSGLYI